MKWYQDPLPPPLAHWYVLILLICRRPKRSSRRRIGGAQCSTSPCSSFSSDPLDRPPPRPSDRSFSLLTSLVSDFFRCPFCFLDPLLARSLEGPEALLSVPRVLVCALHRREPPLLRECSCDSLHSFNFIRCIFIILMHLSHSFAYLSFDASCYDVS